MVYTAVIHKGSAVAQAKKPNPRNKHRGTKLTQLRLREDSRAHISQIQRHLTREGIPVSVSDAVRVALRAYAEKIPCPETLEKQGTE